MEGSVISAAWQDRSAQYHSTAGHSCWSDDWSESIVGQQAWLWAHQPLVLPHDPLQPARPAAPGTGPNPPVSRSRLLLPSRTGFQASSRSIRHNNKGVACPANDARAWGALRSRPAPCLGQLQIRLLLLKPASAAAPANAATGWVCSQGRGKSTARVRCWTSKLLDCNSVVCSGWPLARP